MAASNSDGTIINSYSTGTVTGDYDVGGFVGQEDFKQVENNYSIGKVTGNNNVGGFASNNNGKRKNNYYDNTVNSHIKNDPKNEGRATDELKKQQTYAGWDFVEIWRIDDEEKFVNKGYPYHLWNEERLKTEALLSSSSVVVSSSSSSSSVVVSSSSKDGSSSSVIVRPPQIIASCEGFVDGTTIEHFGEQKKQFCDKRDGKKYVYVTIGDQDWMAENLKYDYDQCGKPLGRCYGDNPANCEKYGMLYTIAEAEPDGWKLNKDRQVVVENLCPEGWHLPSHSELATMLRTVDPQYQDAESSTGGGKNQSSTGLKTRDGWNKFGSKDGGGSDKYGFSALPGGFCGGGCPDKESVWSGGNIGKIGEITYWWTTDVGFPAPLSITWNMTNTSNTVNDGMQSYPFSRFYARCMRNSGEVAVVTSSSSDSKCTTSKPDYSGFEEQVKEAYPDLDLNEIMQETPSSSSNDDPTPIRQSQLAISNISAHRINNAIELQNLPSNAKVEVYNLQGRHIYIGNSENSQILRILVQTKGMYIIKISLGSETKILRVPVM